MKRDLHVFGVSHGTWYLDELSHAKARELFKEGKVKPNRQISLLMRELKTRGVKRLGVETHISEEELQNPFLKRSMEGAIDFRYWLALKHTAHRNGIELVPLEKTTKAEKNVGDFHEMVSMFLDAHAPEGTAYEQRQMWLKHASALKKLNDLTGSPDAEAHAKFLDAVTRHLERRSVFGGLVDVASALTLERSKIMKSNAQKLNVAHAVMGKAHAQDLELDGIHATYITEPEEKKYGNFAEKRKERFTRVAPLMRTIRRIARE